MDCKTVTLVYGLHSLQCTITSNQMIVLSQSQIRDSLTKRAREFNILVDDVAITHLSFGTEVRTLCTSIT